MTDVVRPGERFAAKLAELAARYGTTVEELRAMPRSDGPTFMAHARWEERHPEFAAMERAYEADRRLTHIRVHGDDDFYEPQREFPCPGTLRIVIEHPKLVPVACDACGFEVAVPVEKIDVDQLRKWRQERARLPAKFAGREFHHDDENRDVVEVCQGWAKDFRDGSPLPAPALWGRPGRGKTHLIVAMCEWLAGEHNVDMLYTTVSQLMDELQAGFDAKAPTGRYEVLWARVCSIELLILDDVGAELETEWRMDRLEKLVDSRYAEEKPIVIATNVAPASWPEMIGARAASRLSEMNGGLTLHMTGRDRRPVQQMDLSGEEQVDAGS